MRPLSLVLTVSTLILAAAPAHAEVARQQRDEAGYGYEFDPELMEAASHAANGVILRIRPRAARVTLIRPRTEFRAELLKSVERI